MTLRNLLLVLASLHTLVASAGRAAAAQETPPSGTEAWDCAEVAKPPPTKATESSAQLTVADRIHLQLVQLGLACPEVFVRRDTNWASSPEYRAYWNRFGRSAAKLQYWHTLHIRAWEHETGVFDLLVISTMRTTMKEPDGQFHHLDGLPEVLNWGRNYREASLHDFAATTVNKLLSIVRVAK